MPQWNLPIILQCWQGTGVDMWTGPPADVGRAAAAARPDVFYFQPVGNWTAALPPLMGQGIVDGLREGIHLAADVHPNNFIIPIGYSIGAVIGAKFWRDYIIATGQQSRVPAGIMFGPPMRCPGKANGNKFAGWEMPAADHGGIAGPDDLRPEQTPDTWLDFVQMGHDHGATALYENCKTGPNPWTAEDEEGAVETSIYADATAPDSMSGIINFFKILLNLGHLGGIAMAIWTGTRFLGAGAAADHYNYPTEAATRYLVDVVAPQFR
jgi:hypothetical protein